MAPSWGEGGDPDAVATASFRVIAAGDKPADDVAVRAGRIEPGRPRCIGWSARPIESCSANWDFRDRLISFPRSAWERHLRRSASSARDRCFAHRADAERPRRHSHAERGNEAAQILVSAVVDARESPGPAGVPDRSPSGQSSRKAGRRRIERSKSRVRGQLSCEKKKRPSSKDGLSTL